MTAATFSCHITHEELVAACEREGFGFDDSDYRRGGDHVSFKFEHDGIFVTAIYNVVNGRALGTYAPVVGWVHRFSTDDKLDGTPWFDALLAFLYRD